jgi:hypothetical protein
LGAEALDPAYKRNVIVPADGIGAASWGTGDFGTSPIFVQISGKPLLASVWLSGVPERKAQWRIVKKLPPRKVSCLLRDNLRLRAERAQCQLIRS